MKGSVNITFRAFFIAGINEGYSSILKHNRNALLVNPHEPVDIARAIALLLNYEGLHHRLALRGREDSMKFDWPFLIERIERLYLRDNDKGILRSATDPVQYRTDTTVIREYAEDPIYSTAGDGN